MVIAGAPGAFRRATISRSLRWPPPAEGLGGAGDPFPHALARSERPLVAAVQGLAVGVGTTMLLHCDHVVAGTDARFSTPFVNLGLVPEAASSLLAPRLMGHRRAFELLVIRAARLILLQHRCVRADQCGGGAGRCRCRGYEGRAEHRGLRQKLLATARRLMRAAPDDHVSPVSTKRRGCSGSGCNRRKHAAPSTRSPDAQTLMAQGRIRAKRRRRPDPTRTPGRPNQCHLRQDTVHHRRIARHRPGHCACARPRDGAYIVDRGQDRNAASEARRHDLHGRAGDREGRRPRAAARCVDVAATKRREVRDRPNARRQFGGIDIVVNNASAVSRYAGHRDRLMKRYDLMQAINTRGTFMVLEIRHSVSGEGREPAYPDELAAARHGRRSGSRGTTGYSMAKYGMSLVRAGARRRAARKGHRGECAVAARHHRHRGDQEPAGRRSRDADVAHARDHGGRGLCDLPQARERLHRAIPDRRHVPGWRRRHRFRALPGDAGRAARPARSSCPTARLPEMPGVSISGKRWGGPDQGGDEAPSWAVLSTADISPHPTLPPSLPLHPLNPHPAAPEAGCARTSG